MKRQNTKQNNNNKETETKANKRWDEKKGMETDVNSDSQRRIPFTRTDQRGAVPHIFMGDILG